MDKGRKETSNILRPIGSSSVGARQLEQISATVPLSRPLAPQPTTRKVDALTIASTTATRPLLRTSSIGEYPGWEPASRGGVDAAGRPSQPPSGTIPRASMPVPAPAVHMKNSRNPRRRDTIIDNPEVQRRIQSYGQDKESRSKMVKDNIEKLLNDVKSTRDKHTKKALKTVWMLNFAVGLQVALGALTTGFAAVFRNDNVYIIIALLGGVSTLCASYLARMRGSSEPEKSLGFKKELTALKFDLEHFQRRVDELSPMEEHDEERVRVILSGLQQRYFDIRNSGLMRRFRDEMTGGGYMEEQKHMSGVYGQYRS